MDGRGTGCWVCSYTPVIIIVAVDEVAIGKTYFTVNCVFDEGSDATLRCSRTPVVVMLNGWMIALRFLR